jgi:hypothetical protein
MEFSLVWQSAHCRLRRLLLWSVLHACERSCGSEVPTVVTVNSTILLPAGRRILVSFAHKSWRWRRHAHPKCRWTYRSMRLYIPKNHALTLQLLIPRWTHLHEHSAFRERIYSFKRYHDILYELNESTDSTLVNTYSLDILLLNFSGMFDVMSKLWSFVPQYYNTIKIY